MAVTYLSGQRVQGLGVNRTCYATGTGTENMDKSPRYVIGQWIKSGNSKIGTVVSGLSFYLKLTSGSASGTLTAEIIPKGSSFDGTGSTKGTPVEFGSMNVSGLTSSHARYDFSDGTTHTLAEGDVIAIEMSTNGGQLIGVQCADSGSVMANEQMSNYDGDWTTSSTQDCNYCLQTADDKSTVTDVPVGSQFEETDTRKFYQFSDGGYDSGLGSGGDWNSVANLATNDSVATPSGLNSAGLTKSWFSNGSSTDISTTTGQIIPVDSDITFVTWVYSTDVTTNTQCIFNSEADNYFVVYIANGGDRLEYKVQDGDGESSGGEADYPFAINRWYMIACTFDASTGQTISYVFNDAGTKEEVKDSGVDAIRTVATNTSWRMMEGGSETFDGRILSPCVWNVILSSDDLDDLSASGNGVAMNTIQKDKIVCYWDSQTGTNGTPISNLAVGKKWTERGTAI